MERLAFRAIGSVDEHFNFVNFITYFKLHLKLNLNGNHLHSQ